MHWDSFDAFLKMGGYAFYVWMSFGVTFASCLLEYLQLRSREKELSARAQDEISA